MYLFPVKQLDHMCYSENKNSCSPLLSLECSKHQIMSHKQLFHLLNWLFPHLHLMYYNLPLHIAPHSCSHCYRTEVDSNSMFLLFLHNRNLRRLVYRNNEHSLHVCMFIIRYISDNANTQTLHVPDSKVLSKCSKLLYYSIYSSILGYYNIQTNTIAEQLNCSTME